MRYAVLVLLCTLAAGCGQKGPLFLSEEPAPAAEPATEPGDEEAEDEDRHER